ncbi:hypothetical protein IWQ62_006062 [Dispira parvispora]|uniref:Uncharacterized protein n=1 Tax=Dispira parvispora TaxID=1520584 RepID=A0A9W8ALI9_9FUNG|nr:hypothetical protein IWQ62_006062 [Dispira parvispora]
MAAYIWLKWVALLLVCSTTVAIPHSTNVNQQIVDGLRHGPAGHSHGHDDHDHDHDHDHSHLENCLVDLASQQYSVPLGIAAVFIMFVVSAMGSFLPVVARYYPKLRIPAKLVELGKHFGTGIVLATGFIHMFPGAIFSLTDPCVLPGFAAYSAFAGLFAMIAALFFHLLEFSVSHYEPHQHSTAIVDEKSMHNNTAGSPPSSQTVRHTDTALTIASDCSAYDLPNCNHANLDSTAASHAHAHAHGTLFQEAGAESRRISTYLLEFGIALHSVIIGLALGTADGQEFLPLLIALCFHQFFEGIALGARIAELTYSAAWMPMVNALAYAVTTPLGTALGVALRSVYQARSPTTLAVQGVLDAVSAGILIYTALVNLMAQEFVQPSFQRLPKRTQHLYLAALYAGVATMSVIGIWA